MRAYRSLDRVACHKTYSTLVVESEMCPVIARIGICPSPPFLEVSRGQTLITIIARLFVRRAICVPVSSDRNSRLSLAAPLGPLFWQAGFSGLRKALTIMADQSRIPWCDTTWNPVTGYSRVSQVVSIIMRKP